MVGGPGVLDLADPPYLRGVEGATEGFQVSSGVEEIIAAEFVERGVAEHPESGHQGVDNVFHLLRGCYRTDVHNKDTIKEHRQRTRSIHIFCSKAGAFRSGREIWGATPLVVTVTVTHGCQMWQMAMVDGRRTVMNEWRRKYLGCRRFLVFDGRSDDPPSGRDVVVGAGGTSRSPGRPAPQSRFGPSSRRVRGHLGD